jgi:hypothetical protein
MCPFSVVASFLHFCKLYKKRSTGMIDLLYLVIVADQDIVEESQNFLCLDKISVVRILATHSSK